MLDIALGLAGPILSSVFGGGEKGGGGGTQKKDIGTLALAQAMRAQDTRQATDRPLEEIEPATSAKERGEYLMRMLQAIQNNETEGRSAMEQVAESLMADMQAEMGRIPEQPVVQPQQPAVQEVAAVELKEPEEEEEKYEEPFVRQRSSYA
jgi:hypothetical protein